MRKKVAQTAVSMGSWKAGSKARCLVARSAGLLGHHSAGPSVAQSAVLRARMKAGNSDVQKAVLLEHCLAARSVAKTAGTTVARWELPTADPRVAPTVETLAVRSGRWRADMTVELRVGPTVGWMEARLAVMLAALKVRSWADPSGHHWAARSAVHWVGSSAGQTVDQRAGETAAWLVV